LALAVVTLGPAVAPNVHAQTNGFVIELPEVRNYVALAVGAVPDYIGSDDYTGGIAPAGLVKFGESERYARLIATDLNVNLLDNKQWSFGPALNYRFARDDVDDALVDRMRDIDGTVELGVFGGWTWIGDEDPRHRFSVGGEFLHDVGGEHDGYLLSGSLRYFRPVARPLTLSVGATLTYGSDDYTQTYFGVDAADSARSGLRQFDADSGLRDVRIPLLAVWSFSPKWHLTGGMIYSRVLGDAADSPVVDERGSKHNYYVGAGIAYAW
jgi:outer membrane protein